MVPLTRAARRKAGRNVVVAGLAGLLVRDRRRGLREEPVDGRPASQPSDAAGPPASGPVAGPPEGAPAAAAPVAPARIAVRAEPVLVWTDGRVAPKTGAFAPCAIANMSLDPESVPGPDLGWEKLNEFALSYDGYAYWDDLPELAHRSLTGWIRDDSLPAGLDELRACLFYEQRRWHHFGDAPNGRSLEYLWDLATAIRAAIEARSGPEPGIVSFEDDDAGFLSWVARHPGGYVLNAPRSPPARGAKLHRAACSSVAAAGSVRAAVQTWTVNGPKLCALDARALLALSLIHI